MTAILSLGGLSEKSIRSHVSALKANRPDGRPALVYCVEEAIGKRAAMMGLTSAGRTWVEQKNAKGDGGA